jgi:hypothetical protein
VRGTDMLMLSVCGARARGGQGLGFHRPPQNDTAPPTAAATSAKRDIMSADPSPTFVSCVALASAAAASFLLASSASQPFLPQSPFSFCVSVSHLASVNALSAWALSSVICVTRSAGPEAVIQHKWVVFLIRKGGF